MTTAKTTTTAPPKSGAARRSLALYRSALRAAKLQPTEEGKLFLALIARAAMEEGRKASPQTAEHLQRKGRRQIELVASGKAVLGSVRVS